MKALLAGLAAWFRSLGAGKKTATATGAAAVLAAAVGFVGPWEGERTEAYLDRIASPPVWTVCYGETRGVKAGDRYTSAQCQDMLLEALEGYHNGLLRCLPTLADQPRDVQVALVSWSYNIGTPAACGSTLARLAKAGDWRAACAELPRWNKAGNPLRPVRGLTNRRADEMKICNDALKGS